MELSELKEKLAKFSPQEHYTPLALELVKINNFIYPSRAEKINCPSCVERAVERLKVCSEDEKYKANLIEKLKLYGQPV